jgi:hypothetical protein
MLDNLSIIQMDCSQELENKLQVNGQTYALVIRGFIMKHYCLLDAENKVWLTIKKRGGNEYRLVFANGMKYQMEVLAYTSLAYVFYDKEDTEIFRLMPSDLHPDAVCLLVFAIHIPQEEFATLVTWGFYFCRHYKGEKSCRPAA